MRTLSFRPRIKLPSCILHRYLRLQLRYPLGLRQQPDLTGGCLRGLDREIALAPALPLSTGFSSARARAPQVGVARDLKQ